MAPPALTPEMLQAVSQLGESYVSFLYFKALLPYIGIPCLLIATCKLWEWVAERDRKRTLQDIKDYEEDEE